MGRSRVSFEAWPADAPEAPAPRGVLVNDDQAWYEAREGKQKISRHQFFHALLDRMLDRLPGVLRYAQ